MAFSTHIVPPGFSFNTVRKRAKVEGFTLDNSESSHDRLRGVSSPAIEPETTPTPILDRQEPLPPFMVLASRSQRTIGAFIGLGIGMVINLFLFWHPPFMSGIRGWILTAFAPIFADELTVTLLLWMSLAASLGWFAAMAIHESGHALIGALMGFRFNSLRISRLEFHRPFRISLYRGRGTGVNGWATMFPDTQDQLIPRTVAMLFAGPGANLLSLGLVLILPISRGFFAASLAFWSLLFGVINLVPLSGRAMLSDGKRILMLLQNRAEGERWLALIRLSAELRLGIMPEALSPLFLTKALAISDGSPDTVTAHAIAYSKAFYERDDREAARVLEICLQNVGSTAPIMREALMSDAAVFQARKRKRLDLAEQWLGDIPQKTELPWMRSRAEAAIMEAKGDTAQALEKLFQIERMIAAIPDEGRREISLRFHRRWIAELQTESVRA